MKDSTNLDFLRSLAVLLVVGDHSIKMIFGITSIRGIDVNTIGRLGVLFFFVHTCLVLMYSLERQDARISTIGLSIHFYIRRIFRIFPLSIAVVLVIVTFHIPSSHIAGAGIVAGYHASLSEIAVNLLLLQNLFYGNDILGVLWSLPWEVQMYVVLPLLYVVLARNRRLLALLTIWVLATFFLSNRIYVAQFFPAFLPGIIAYVIRRRSSQPLPASIFPLFLLFLVFGYCLLPSNQGEQTIIPLLLGLGIPFFKDIKSRVIASTTQNIAKYSYGIYLTHLFCLYICFEVIHLVLPVRLLIYASMLFIIPYGLHLAIERPCIELGKRISSGLGRYSCLGANAAA